MNKKFDPAEPQLDAVAHPPTASEEDTVYMPNESGRRGQASLGMLQSMFDGLSDGAAVIDMQGRLVQFNAAAEAILGMGATRGLSENWSQEYGWFLPDGRTPFPHDALPLMRALRGERVEGVEMYARNSHLPAGKWLRVSAAPIYDERGRQSGAMAILRDESDRRKVESALESERRFLRHLITTQDRDRRLTAYDLHDGVVQLVTAALMRLEAFASQSPDIAGKDEDYNAAMRLIRDAIEEARQLIGGMRPPVLDGNGVIGAIEYLVEHHKKVDGLQVEFVHDVQFQRLSALQESTLFRIVQEALHNAARHSGSDRARVEMHQIRDLVRVMVRDEGCGFDLGAARLRKYGLRGIEERARLLGGMAEVESAPGQGTSICVTLPLINALPDEIAPTEI